MLSFQVITGSVENIYPLNPNRVTSRLDAFILLQGHTPVITGERFPQMSFTQLLAEAVEVERVAEANTVS